MRAKLTEVYKVQKENMINRLKKIQEDLDKALKWMGLPSRTKTDIPPLDSARQGLTQLIKDLEKKKI